MIIFCRQRNMRGCSSLGRALEWHSRGSRFDPDHLHQEKSTTSVVLFCFVRQRCFGFTLLPCSGVSPVFAGIAVSILEGSAPEYAPLIQGTIAAAADARQPGPGKTLRHTRKITGRHPVPGAFSDIERSWNLWMPAEMSGGFLPFVICLTARGSAAVVE